MKVFAPFPRVAALLAIAVLSLPAAGAETEGPRAFFGFVTHYENSPAGRGEVKVLQVVPDGPAARAGLRAGDMIVAFNGVAFRFADEYEYMRSLSVFESGREVKLAVERDGSPAEAKLTPAPLSPEQVAGLDAYMAQLGGCIRTGLGCPCAMDHRKAAEPDELLSPYRRFTNAVARQGGTTVLAITKDAEGRLTFRSSPVPLPDDFEIGVDEDGMLWKQIEKLRNGEKLELEIAAEGSGIRRVRILGPAAGG